MEANYNAIKAMNQLTFQDESVKVDFSVPRNNVVNSLDDFAKKSIYSSYRSRVDKLETLGFQKKYNQDFDTCSEKETSNRAHSVKPAFAIKPTMREKVVEKKPTNDYSQNLFKLKLQEMTFKFKTKVATILKQIDTPLNQFSKFTTLSRIDDILEFLSEVIKGKLSNSQASKAQNTKTLSKQRQLLSEYQHQIEQLKKKQLQKEAAQKTFKAKLKQSHSQIRDLYDKINQKQRQLSQKMTQIYQLKSLSKQSDKLVQSYKQKCMALQRQLSEQTSNHSAEVKKIISNFKNFEEQNQQLKEKNEELHQIIQNQKQKQAKILQLNQHLNEELQRWKERLESDTNVKFQAINESRSSKENLSSNESNPLAGKLSNLTLQNEKQRLNYKIKDLEKQNRNLSRDLASYMGIKERYDELLACINAAGVIQSQQSTQPTTVVIQKWKQMVGQQQLFEVQYFYKNKIEEIVKEWRDKLIQIISKSEQEEENLKKQLMKLQKANQQLQSKVFLLANEKYLIQNKLIQKEREIYELTKLKKVKRDNSHDHSVENDAKSDAFKTKQGQTNNQQSGVESIDEKHD